MDLHRAIGRLVVAGLVVVGAGRWLPCVAVDRATAMGWNRCFVDTLFVAFATPMRELSETAAAVRIGALDLAVGNVPGSTLFNVAIIAIDDLFSTRGHCWPPYRRCMQ